MPQLRNIFRGGVVLVFMLIVGGFLLLENNVAEAIVGPSSPPGSGGGSLSIDANRNLGFNTSVVGTSTGATPPGGNFGNIFMIAATSSPPGFGLRSVASGCPTGGCYNQSLYSSTWVMRLTPWGFFEIVNATDSGTYDAGPVMTFMGGSSYNRRVMIGNFYNSTSTMYDAAFGVIGNIKSTANVTGNSFVGNLSGSVSAGNVTGPAAFGNNYGTYNFAAPGAFAIGTATTTGLPSNGLYVVGNVGIGTASPGGKLTVVTSSGDGGFRVQYTGGEQWFSVGDGVAGMVKFNAAGGYTLVGTSAVNQGARMNIASGSVGTKGLSVYGISGQTANIVEVSSVDGAGGNYFVVKNSGNVGIGTTAPLTQLMINNATNGSNTNGISIGKVEAGAGMWTDVNEELGRLSWYGVHTSANAAVGAYISAVADDNWDISEAPARLTFWTTPTGSLTNTERMRIDRNGNIGIGTTAPAYKLDVAGAVNATEFYQNGSLFVGGGGGGGSAEGWSRTTTTGAVYLATSTDNVGIGTTAPGKTLDVNSTGVAGRFYGYSIIGGAGVNNGAIDIGGSVTAGGYIDYSYSGNTTLRISNKYEGNPASQIQLGFGNSNTPMTIQQAGNVGISTTTPSYKLDVVGTAQFSQPVIVGTPTTNSHAATKNYVDSVLTGGASDGSFNTLAVAGTSTLATTGGSVGIGTTAPGTLLDVRGTILSQGDDKGFTAKNAAGTVIAGIGAYSSGVTNEGILSLRNAGTTKVYLAANHDSYFNGGNVGIGTTTPAYGLDVETGSIKVNNNITGSGSSGTIYLGDGSFTKTYGGSWTFNGGVSVTNGGIQNDSSFPISNANGYTQSGTSDNTFTGKTTFSNATYSALFTGGNVGIATTTPSYKLDVVGTAQFSQPVIVGTPTQNAHATTKSYVDSMFTGSGQWTTNGGLVYLTSTTQNVGIGRITPRAKLDVTGGNIITTDRLAIVDNSDVGRVETKYVSSVGSIGTIQAEDFAIITGDTNKRIYIKAADGNVGIGTTSPSNLLTLSKDAGTTSNPGVSKADVIAFKVYYTGYDVDSVKATIGSGFDGVTGWNTTNGLLTFSTANAGTLFERMRIMASGNVGISTTTPSYKLDVVGTSQFSQPVIVGTPTQNAHATTKSYVDSMFSGSGQWTTNGGLVYLTSTTQNVGIGTTAPGAKLDVAGSVIIDSAQKISSRGELWLSGQAGGVILYDGSQAHSLGIYNGATEPILLRSSGVSYFNGGNVGIGTTNPLANLTVYTVDGGNAHESIRLWNKNNAPGTGTEIVFGGGETYTEDAFIRGFFTGASVGQLALGTSNSEIMRLTNGNVGIATTTPNYKLDVVGTSQFSQPVIVGTPTQNAHATTKSYVDSMFSGSGQWTTNGGLVYLTSTTQNVGIGTTSPGVALDVKGDIRTTKRASTGGSLALSTASGSIMEPYIGAESEASDVGLYFRARPTSGSQTGFSSGAYYFDVRKSDQNVVSSGNLFQILNGGNEKVTINYNGNVGIGTTNPVVLLAVQNTVSTDWNEMVNVLAPSAANGVHTGGIYFGRARSTDELGHLTFVPSATTQKSQIRLGIWGRNDLLSIEGSGNVGISTTTPSYKLDVVGTSQFSQPVIVGTPTQNAHATTKSYVDSMFTGSGQWTTNGGLVYLTSTTQNVGIGTTNPLSGLVVEKNTAGGRGGEISIVNKAAGQAGNSAALNFGLENSTYNGDDGNAQIQAILTGASAADLAFSTWNGSSWGERMRIQSGGNVGIGTTGPTRKFHVVESTNSLADGMGQFFAPSITTANYASIWVGKSAANGEAAAFGHQLGATPSTDSYSWMVNWGDAVATQSLILKKGGNVGIGTAAPDAQLTVNPTGVSWNEGISINPSSNGYGGLYYRVTAGSITNTWFVGKEATTHNYTITRNGLTGMVGTTRVDSPFQINYSNGNTTFGGSVGIATTTPSYKLDVVGTSQFSQPVIVGTPTQNAHATTKSYVDSMFSGSGQWTTNGGLVYLTSTTQNVGIGTTSPNAGKLQIGATAGTAIATYGANLFLNENDVDGPNAFGGLELATHIGATTEGYGGKLYSQNSGGYIGIATRYGSPTWTERLVIKEQTGYVGIGTTGPQYPLTVYSSTGAIFGTDGVSASNRNATLIASNAAHFFEWTGTSGLYRNAMIYGTRGESGDGNGAALRIAAAIGSGAYGTFSPTPIATFDFTGNVGISTTTPQYKLSVNGTGSFSQPVIVGTPTQNAHATTKSYVDSMFSGSGQWTTNGGLVYLTSTTQNVGIGRVTPRAKLDVTGGNIITTDRLAIVDNSDVGRVETKYVSSVGSIGTIQAEDFAIITGDTNKRIYIKAADGNVGIGTTAPGTNLEVYGTDAEIMAHYTGNSRGGLRAMATQRLALLTTATSDDLVFGWENGHKGTFTEYMRIDNGTGNVGISTTTPSYKLDVVGTSQFSQPVIVGTPTQNAHATTKSYVDSMFTGSGQWTTNGGLVYLTSTTQNVGIGTTGPLAKLDVAGIVNFGTIAPKTDWYTAAYYGLQVNGGTTLWGRATDTHLSSNYYVKNNSGVAQDTYIASNYATDFWQDNAAGDFLFRRANSGTAGNAISWTTPMIIKNSGNVGIGTTNPQIHASGQSLKILQVGGTSQLDNTPFQDAIVITGRQTTETSGEIFDPTKPSIGIRFTGDFSDPAQGQNTTIAGIYGFRSGGWRGGLVFRTKNGTSAGNPGASHDINAMIISPAGRVGIATTTPNYILDVVGTSQFSQPVIVGTPTANTHATTKSYVDSMFTGSGQWTTNGGLVYLTSTTQNVGIGTTAPVLKTEIVGSLGGPATSGTTQTGIMRLRTSDAILDFGVKDSSPYGFWLQAGDQTDLSATKAILLNPNGGNVGIGTTSPGAKLDVSGNIRTSGTLLYDSGALGIYDSGGNTVDFSGGDAHPSAFIFRTTGVTTGAMYINSSGNVGIATTTPNYALTVSGYGWFNQPVIVGTPVSPNHAATKSYVDSIVGGGAGAGSFTTLAVSGTSTFSGNWQLGGAALGNMNLNGYNIVGINKITASVIDPLYKIDGEMYATYGSSVAGGIREEYVGRGKLTEKSQISNLKSQKFEYTIDFSRVEKGSDLWVWYNVVDFSKDNTEVLATAYNSLAKIGYRVEGKKIVFFSDEATEFSFRLFGKRHDWKEWGTKRDTEEKASSILQSK